MVFVFYSWLVNFREKWHGGKALVEASCSHHGRWELRKEWNWGRKLCWGTLLVIHLQLDLTS